MKNQDILSTPAVKTNLRVFGYARESTKDQAFNGFNIDDQEKKIKSYYEIYYSSSEDQFTMLREEGASAKTTHRPQMDSLIDMVKNRQVDVIIIHNLDRLTRRVKDLSTLLELFSKYNVQLVSITEKIDTTSSMGRFFVYLIVLIAQWEEDTISERTIRGMDESARQGNYSKGGRPPLGYRKNKGTGKLEIVENEAVVIRDIFNKISNNDFTMLSLSHFYNDNKVLNTHWYQSKVQKILQNPLYYGHFEFHGVAYDNHQPAIVSKQVFDEAKESICHRKHILRVRYIFQGKVKCMMCGEYCRSAPTHKARKVYKYYFCPKCKQRINEERLLFLADETLTKIAATSYLKIKENDLKKKYDIHVGNVNAITATFQSSTISPNYFSDVIENENQEANRLIEELKLARNEAKNKKHFASSSYLEQRKMLELIRYIVVDLNTKTIYRIRKK